MKTDRLDEIIITYIENTPITDYEIKKMLGHQIIAFEIIDDALHFSGIDRTDIDYNTYNAMNNAFNLGLMTGKQLERKKRKQQSSVYSREVTPMNRVVQSIKNWEHFNEKELLEIILELMEMKEDHFLFRVKDNLIRLAKSIYQEKYHDVRKNDAVSDVIMEGAQVR